MVANFLSGLASNVGALAKEATFGGVRRVQERQQDRALQRELIDEERSNDQAEQLRSAKIRALGAIAAGAPIDQLAQVPGFQGLLDQNELAYASQGPEAAQQLLQFYGGQVAGRGSPKDRFAVTPKGYVFDYETQEFLSPPDSQRPSSADQANLALAELRRAQTQRLTQPQQQVAQGGEGGDPAADFLGEAPVRETYDFDVIDGATGPIDALKTIARRLPGVADALPGVGETQRRARRVTEEIAIRARNTATANSSRLSNFDLQTAERLAPKAGALKSAQAYTDELVEARARIIADLERNVRDAQNISLDKAVRRDAQKAARELQPLLGQIEQVLASSKEFQSRQQQAATGEPFPGFSALTPEEQAEALELLGAQGGAN